MAGNWQIWTTDRVLALQVLNRVAISTQFNRLIANSNPAHAVAIYMWVELESATYCMLR